MNREKITIPCNNVLSFFKFVFIASYTSGTGDARKLLSNCAMLKIIYVFTLIFTMVTIQSEIMTQIDNDNYKYAELLLTSDKSEVVISDMPDMFIFVSRGTV